MTNLDWEEPAIGGKELKGPLGWVEVATPEGCGHPVEWFDEVWVHGMRLPRVGCVSDGAAGRQAACQDDARESESDILGAAEQMEEAPCVSD